MERVYLVYLLTESILLFLYLRLRNHPLQRVQISDELSFSSERRESSWSKIAASVFLFAAYIIYILFSVFKKVDPKTSAHDAYNYMKFFMDVDPSLSLGSFLKSDLEFEPGFSLLYWFSKRIYNDYHFLLWIVFTLVFILYVSYLRKIYTRSHSFLMICTVFLLLIGQFNTMRMTLSIGIGLHILPMLQKKKWIAACLTAVLAMSFHITAAILFPMILVVFCMERVAPTVSFGKFMQKISAFKTEKHLTIIVLGMVMAVASIGILNRLLAGTSKDVYIGDSGKLAVGTYTIVLIIFVTSIWKFKKVAALSSLNLIMIEVLPICLCCIPLQYSVGMIYRMTLFFNPIILGIIPSLLKAYSRKTMTQIMISAFLYFYMFVRIYSFFTEELGYVGEYTNTLIPGWK